MDAGLTVVAESPAFREETFGRQGFFGQNKVATKNFSAKMGKIEGIYFSETGLPRGIVSPGATC